MATPIPSVLVRRTNASVGSVGSARFVAVALIAALVPMVSPFQACAQGKQRWIDRVYRPGDWLGGQVAPFVTTNPATDTLALEGQIDGYARAPRWRVEIRRIQPNRSFGEPLVLVAERSRVMVVTGVAAVPLAQNQAKDDPLVQAVLAQFDSAGNLRHPGVGRIVLRTGDQKVARVIVRHPSVQTDFPESLLAMSRGRRTLTDIVQRGTGRVAENRSSGVAVTAVSHNVETPSGYITVVARAADVTAMDARRIDPLTVDSFVRAGGLYHLAAVRGELVEQTGVGPQVEAIRRLQEAVRLFPASPGDRKNLGVALRLAGRTEEAIAELREAVRLNYDEPEYHYELGLGLREAGALGEAVVEFQTAFRLDRRRGAYRAELLSTARMAALSGEKPQASRSAEALIEAGRNADADSLLSSLISVAGASLDQRDRSDRAELAQWYFLRGVARHGTGSLNASSETWDSALSDYFFAMSLDSSLAGPALNNAAKIAEAQGRFAEAAHLYWQASIQSKPNPVFAFNLGSLFERLQEPDSALARYRESLSLNSRYLPARRALFELALQSRADEVPRVALDAAADGYAGDALDLLKRLLLKTVDDAESDSLPETALTALVEVLASLNMDASYMVEREEPELHRVSEHRPQLAPAVADLLAALTAFGSSTFSPDTTGWWFQRLERFRAYSLLLTRLGDQALAAGAKEDGRRYYLGAVGPRHLQRRWRNFNALIPALALTVEADPRQYSALSEGFDSSTFENTTSVSLDEFYRLYTVLLRLTHQQGDLPLTERYAARMTEVTRSLAQEFRRQGSVERAERLTGQTRALYTELGINPQIPP